jgi:lipoprotein-anchoring transpeptidase ErfK/SrfK
MAVHRAGGGRSWARRVRRPLLVIGIIVFVAALGTTVTAFAVDRVDGDHILPGIRVAGVDIGGMTTAQAISAVRARLDPPLQRRLTIQAGTKTLHVHPSDLGVHPLVAAAVDQAEADSRAMSWLPRSYHRLFHWSVGTSIPVRYVYPTTEITPLIARLAASLALTPQNASLQASANDMSISFTHARAGRSLSQTKAVALVLEALRTDAPAVRLPVTTLPPKVTDAKLGKTITVDLSTNTLRLYDGFRVQRTYPVATATTPYSTPIGTWHVVEKELHPVWINPGTAWAAGMPKEIGPGPANPLGLRALRLDAPGILIHGTPEDSSIGHWASHGCIRMHETDAIALYPLVPVGTPVIVFGAPPWGASTVVGSQVGF